MICTTEQKPEPILSSLKELDTRRFLITKARIMDAGYGHTFFLGMTRMSPRKRKGRWLQPANIKWKGRQKRARLCFHAINNHQGNNLFHA